MVSLPNIDSIVNNTDADNPACDGESIQLESTFIPGAEYLWTGPNGFISTVNNPLLEEVSTLNEGIYSLVVTFDGCQSEVLETNVFVDAAMETPVALGESSVCEGTDIVLEVMNPDPEELYKWYRESDNFEVGEGSTLILPNASIDIDNQYYVIANSDNCSSSRSNSLDITVDELPETMADAGIDEVICTDNYILSAALDTEGQWIHISNGDVNIDNPNASTSSVTNLQFGLNQFSWSVSNGACQNITTDTVNITYNDSPLATDDIYTLRLNEELEENVLSNDTPNTSDFTVSNFTDPEFGTLELDNDGKFIYVPNENFVGTDSYSYELCHMYCPDNCVEATVYITIGQESECFAPTIMTPNGDGINDTFTIPCLNNYNGSNMCIYNRYGDEVFQDGNYQNNWDGTYKSKDQDLPSGTYFYMLQVNDGRNTVLTGYIFIER